MLGKKVSGNFISSRDRLVKRTETRQGPKFVKKTTLLWNNGGKEGKKTDEYQKLFRVGSAH